MELYFLRHGEAADRSHSGATHDSERPLTAEGLKQMQQVAKGMKRLGVAFDAVLSSPYLRARQTAEIISAHYQYKGKTELSEVLTPNAEFRDFVELLKKFDGDKKILFIGHQPGLGSFVSSLISGDQHISINLRKGGLCRVDTSELGTAALAYLEWLLTPEQICLAHS